MDLNFNGIPLPLSRRTSEFESMGFDSWTRGVKRLRWSADAGRKRHTEMTGGDAGDGERVCSEPGVKEEWVGE
jgi:hypothetical protein